MTIEQADIIDVTGDSFQTDVVDASYQTPVLVDFWANWCSPCHMLAPVLERMAGEYAGRLRLAKVDVDREQQLAERHGIRGLPTVKLYRDGQVATEFTGVQAERAIQWMLERHLPRPSDDVREQALAAAQAGEPERACELAREGLALDPERAELHRDLAGFLIDAGEPEAALVELDRLPVDEAAEDASKRLRARAWLATQVAADGDGDTADLQRRVDEAPDDLQARLRLGAALVLAGDAEPGLAQFIEIMRRDRSFGDDAGRRALLNAFELVDDPALVNRYRRQMSSLLF